MTYRLVIATPSRLVTRLDREADAIPRVGEFIVTGLREPIPVLAVVHTDHVGPVAFTVAPFEIEAAATSHLPGNFTFPQPAVEVLAEAIFAKVRAPVVGQILPQDAVGLLWDTSEADSDIEESDLTATYHLTRRLLEAALDGRGHFRFFPVPTHEV